MTPADAVVAFFHAVDGRDWPAVRAGLADSVDTDYTPRFGGEPERLTADALVPLDRSWRALAAPVNARIQSRA